jgi:hypothetical protein
MIGDPPVTPQERLGFRTTGSEKIKCGKIKMARMAIQAADELGPID